MGRGRNIFRSYTYIVGYEATPTRDEMVAQTLSLFHGAAAQEIGDIS